MKVSPEQDQRDHRGQWLAGSSLLNSSVPLRLTATTTGQTNEANDIEDQSSETLRIACEEHASLESPNTRIIMAVPKSIQLERYESTQPEGYDSRDTTPGPDGYTLEPIVQHQLSAYYDVKLAVPNSFRASLVSGWIHCRVYYVPLKDWCLLRAMSDTVILYQNRETLAVKHGESVKIEPGFWSLFVDAGSASRKLVSKLLLVPRAYRLDVLHLKPSQHSTAPIRLVIRCINLRKRGFDVIQNSSTPLTELRTGEKAVIITGRSTMTANSTQYRLKHTGNIRRTPYETTFYCRNDQLDPADTLAKILVSETDDVIGVAEAWETEYSILSKAEHPNIVKLKTADGRLFALYLEQLPDDLATLKNFSREEQVVILRDIAKALQRLESMGYAHQDITPKNIYFSRKRGAVLANFVLAVPLSTVSDKGAVLYMPPEFHSSSHQRGHKGDIWALGVVMLFVMGKTSLAEWRFPQWHVEDLTPNNTEAKTDMRTWYKEAREARNKLSKEDTLECVVRLMLDDEPAKRPTAQYVVNYLSGKLAKAC